MVEAVSVHNFPAAVMQRKAGPRSRSTRAVPSCVASYVVRAPRTGGRGWAREGDHMGAEDVDGVSHISSNGS